MKITEIIILALTLPLGYCIWRKAVDRVDELLKRRVSDKTYNALTWSIIIITYGIFIMHCFNV